MGTARQNIEQGESVSDRVSLKHQLVLAGYYSQGAEWGNTVGNSVVRALPKAQELCMIQSDSTAAQQFNLRLTAAPVPIGIL